MSENNGKLTIGKLPADLLAKAVISKIRGSIWPNTFVGPRIGEDAAIIRLPCCDMIIHADPITEAVKGIGKLAVIVAANDVAASGACPTHAIVTILLPPSFDADKLSSIINEIQETSRGLGIDIIGGHTEVSPGLSKPIIVVSMIGFTCPGCSVSTGNLSPGDIIVQVGEAGMEGASIIMSDFSHLVKECGLESKLEENNIERISIVEPACLLSSSMLVKSMHDATEGGIVGALVEMAHASKTIIEVYEDSIIVNEDAKNIGECLGIDPLKLISSGTLIVAVSPEKLDKVLRLLKSTNYKFATIGKVIEPCKNEESCMIILRNKKGEKKLFRTPPTDEISRVWQSYGEEKH